MSTGDSGKKPYDCTADSELAANVHVNVESGQEFPRGGARQRAEQRLVRKLDLRLLPTIIIIYLMNYIDRVAITSARLKGLQADLGLSDVQYDTVVAILYASYSPAQIPSNMALNYVSSPSFYIGTCVVLWGLISALTGLTRSFFGVLTCRIFLGLPEAAFFPGAVYLLSSWYTRKELALRSAILLSGSLMSNAFGSFWAAGILGNMNGVMGIVAWRWLFYIEGAVSIFIGLLAMWLLPDYPYNTKWLNHSEKHLAQVRMAEDAGEADTDSQQVSIYEGLKLALKDPKVWLFIIMTTSQYVGSSFSIFFPTLTATFGYSTTVTLLMAAPPWVFATIVTIVNARHADTTEERFFHVTVWWWVIMVGYIISLSTMKTAWRYFSLFLMASGTCVYSVTFAWLANTIPRPPAKRAAAIGLVNGIGNLGNVMGSYIWKSSWSPGYHPSMIIAFSALVIASLLSLVIRMLLIRENRRTESEELHWMPGPEKERIEEAARLEGITFDEAVRRRKGFRYLY